MLTHLIVLVVLLLLLFHFFTTIFCSYDSSAILTVSRLLLTHIVAFPVVLLKLQDRDGWSIEACPPMPTSLDAWSFESLSLPRLEEFRV